MPNSLIVYEPLTGSFRVNGASVGRKNRRGYVYIFTGGKQQLAHRLAWFLTHGRWPTEIDHINRNKSDNRLANLRECSRSVNSLNKPLRPENISGCAGVRKHTQSGKWIADIKVNGKFTYLGLFADVKDAIKARKQAEKTHPELDDRHRTPAWP